MSVQQLKLESVRRKTGGRIHLTPRVPKSGAVTTLCGQTLAAGTFAAVETEADCTNCIRRSKDQGRISGAFFEQDEGSELLRLSLEQAKFRNPTRGDATPRPGAPEKPVVWPTAKPPAEVIPERLGELVTRGFRPAGEGVWRSPGGVIVKMRKRSKQWLFEELVFEGSVIATRVGGDMRLKAGDVEVSPTEDGYEVQLKKA
ncbi:MAG TPA: hypothetical protein VNG04_09590 [Candidatus Acidoferrum sp.]|nr:hypothetical protein [Candidatus Acidoferrum sp.]